MDVLYRRVFMRKVGLLLASLLVSLSVCPMFVGCNDSGDGAWSLDLSDYVLNIGNATALGVYSGEGEDVATTSVKALAKKEDTEQKNYIAMSTTTDYDANAPEADATGLTKVSFTKTVTEDVQVETTGTKYVLARNKTVSFAAVEGFTYSVYYKDEAVYTDVQDNDNTDEEEKEGIISLSVQKKDKDYEIRYHGIGEETTVTQEEIDGEIDKLYVLNEYTFMSFVPKGESKRPTQDGLTFDTDGIALYDKCDYFSNNERQSFIVHNATGYVYPLKNFNVKQICGGCLLSADDNYIYDFKINEQDEVEIFSLFQNDSIEWYSCFKDKYGNKFIQNNRLNMYDESTNTYFYVFNPFGYSEEVGQFRRWVDYELTENNECIQITYSDGTEMHAYNEYNSIIESSIILANGEKRVLTTEDSFKIYYDANKYKANGDYKTSANRVLYKVENGIIFGYSHNIGYSSAFSLIQFDGINNKYSMYNSSSIDSHEDTFYYSVEFLEEYDVIMEYFNGTVYYYKNVWDGFAVLRDMPSTDNGYEASGTGRHEDCGSMTTNSAFTPIKILENCNISEDFTSFLTYGVAGNTYYDIVAEEEDGETVINQYVKGTYQKPQIKVILQPLNK